MNKGQPFSAGLVIANPAAGSVDEKLLAQLTRICRQHLPVLTVYRTTEPGDATRVTGQMAGQVEVVVTVGGDGTVREVVRGLLDGGRPAVLMVVPGGTGNSSYLAQWGELAWPAALTAALTGTGAHTRWLDVADLVELDEPVLLGACSGLIAEALLTARSVPVTGRQRYRVALAKAAAAHRPYPGRVTVDGEVVHSGPTVLANVGGGQYRGGTYRLLPHSLLDDGLLDVCVIGGEVNPVDVPELTLTGAHLGHPGVVYAQGRRITVERTDGDPIMFEHDGELGAADRSGFTLEVRPQALPVRCRADLPIPAQPREWGADAPVPVR